MSGLEWEEKRLDDGFSIPMPDLTKKRGRKPRDPNAPKKPRRHRDAYPTVFDLAKAIVERVKLYVPSPRFILEPTAGDGPFVKACRAAYGPDVKIGAIDIDERCSGPCFTAGANAFGCSDILTVPPDHIARFDLSVGNLPFVSAAQILKYLVTSNPRLVIFNICPVSFFGATKEPTDRNGNVVVPRDAAFWRTVRLNYFAPIHPRPSFTGDGRTDRMEYGLFGFVGGVREPDPGLGLLDVPIVWG